MIEMIMLAIVRIINTFYYFIADTLGLRFIDTPVTYIFIMVVSLALIPLSFKNIYYIYAHPNEHEHISLTKRVVKACITIVAIFFLGYANFMRFSVPA